MKSQFSKLILAIFFAASFVLSGSVSACGCSATHIYKSVHHHHCKYIKGHWHNGHYIHGHKVCRS